MLQTIRAAVLLKGGIHRSRIARKPRDPTPQVTAAFRDHHKNLEGALARIASIEIREVVRLLEDLLRRGSDSLSDEENELACRLDCEANDYAISHEQANEAYFSLIALHALDQNLSRDRILAGLIHDPWFIRHEVLTRWGWMSWQRMLLRKGEPLLKPYRCLVAGRGLPGRNSDREFSTLLRFVHWLCLLRGDRLLYVEKQGRRNPDFIVEDEGTGQQVGVEITEAPQSAEWAAIRDVEAAIGRVLSEFARERSLAVRVLDWSQVPSLSSLCGRSRRNEIERMAAEVALKLSCVSIDKNNVRISSGDLDLRLTLAPSDAPAVWWESTKAGPEIREEEDQFVESIVQRVSSKLKKGESSVRPCNLVLYPNHDIGADLDTILERAKKRLPPGIESHFDAVWFAGERVFDQLWPFAAPWADQPPHEGGGA